MVDHFELNRKFERMFPNVAHEEREYERDLLADWRLIADVNRRNKQNNLSSQINKLNDNKEETLKQILEIWYIYDINKESWKEMHYMSEKDKDWNVVIDKTNKRVKFVDEASWKFVYREYVDDDSEENSEKEIKK